jgi:O-antigen ligase
MAAATAGLARAELEAPGSTRRVDSRLIALTAPLAVGLALTASAAANGGYFPTSWGWLAIGFGWLAAIALVTRRRIAFEAVEIVYMGAFTLLTGWVWVSTAWSSDAPGTMLEGERDLILPLALAAAFLLASSSTPRLLVGGVLAASATVSTYALATRLVPDRLGQFDSVAGYRLSTPLGYWNALGLFAAIGSLLALGVAARGKSLAARAFAASTLPLLLSTLYFTYSRGAWLALVIGFAFAVATDPRRLQLLAAAALLAPISALGVYLAWRSVALTHARAPLAEAAHQGHRLAAALVLLALLSIGAVMLLAGLERRIEVGAGARRWLTIAFALCVLSLSVVGFAVGGGPVELVRQVRHAFAAPPPQPQRNLNQRLFSLSGDGRVPLWRVALDDISSHPLLGSGAGTYEQYWLQRRPIPAKVRDAHSLYLETLAELGPVGLALLLVGLAAPLVVLRRARRHPLIPAVAGAYVAFLAHAAVEWDWEVPTVTLAALFCGCAILIAGRTGRRYSLPAVGRVVGLGALGVVLAGAFVGLIANLELARAESAASVGDWRVAATHARDATTWEPFGAASWQQLGEAQLGLGRDADAEASFRRAISRSPRDWTLWFDLARASSGRAQAEALDQAARLDPLAPELVELRKELRGQGAIPVMG